VNPQGFVLSPASAAKVKDLISRTGDDPKAPRGFPYSRQITFVRCTGAIASGYYPGKVVAWNAAAEDWIEYSAEVSIKLNQGTLTTDEVYATIRSGDLDGVPVFVAIAGDAPSMSTETIDVTGTGLDTSTNPGAWSTVATRSSLDAGTYLVSWDTQADIFLTSGSTSNSVEVQVQVWDDTNSVELALRRVGGAGVTGLISTAGNLFAPFTLAYAATVKFRARVIKSGSPGFGSVQFIGQNKSAVLMKLP
jgi:hypothetical protein